MIKIWSKFVSSRWTLVIWCWDQNITGSLVDVMAADAMAPCAALSSDGSLSSTRIHFDVRQSDSLLQWLSINAYIVYQNYMNVFDTFQPVMMKFSFMVNNSVARRSPRHPLCSKSCTCHRALSFRENGPAITQKPMGVDPLILSQQSLFNDCHAIYVYCVIWPMWHCSHSRFSVVVTDELVPIHLFFCSHHLTMMTWAGWSMSEVSSAICMSLVISSIVMYCATLLFILMLENIELLPSRPNDIQGFMFRNE